MTQTIKKGVKELLAEAQAGLPAVTAEAAMALLDDDAHVFVDLRDGIEQETTGTIPGALVSSRGMLEFHIDPDSPAHKPEFAADKTFVFYCASGGRSALAAKVASEMGLGPVINLTGGIIAWKKAGGPLTK